MKGVEGKSLLRLSVLLENLQGMGVWKVVFCIWVSLNSKLSFK